MNSRITQLALGVLTALQFPAAAMAAESLRHLPGITVDRQFSGGEKVSFNDTHPRSPLGQYRSGRNDKTARNVKS